MKRVSMAAAILLTSMAFAPASAQEGVPEEEAAPSVPPGLPEDFQFFAPEAEEEPEAEPTLSYDPEEPRIERLFRRLAELPEEESFAAGAIAESILAELSRHESPTAELLLRRARAAKRRGEVDQALDHLTRVIAFQPDFAEAWHFRATLYFEKEEIGLALRDLEQALRIEPRHFSAWVGLGVILEQTGRKDLAAAAFRSALAWHPYLEGARTHLLELDQEEQGEPL